MGRQAREHVAQVLPGVVPIELGRLHQAHDHRCALAGQFASGEEFLNAPLINSFLLPEWFASIPDAHTQDEVRASLRRLIDEEEHDAETPWTFSIKATFVLGRRGE